MHHGATLSLLFPDSHIFQCSHADPSKRNSSDHRDDRDGKESMGRPKEAHEVSCADTHGTFCR